MITAGYLRQFASVQTAVRACCIAPECITKLFIPRSKSVDQLSLGGHSLVALPSNAAREEVVRFAVHVWLASVFHAASYYISIVMFRPLRELA